MDQHLALLALADPEPNGRQVTLTTTGHPQYARLHGTSHPTDLPAPSGGSQPDLPGMPARRGRRVSRPAQWVFSPLLSHGDHPDGVLQARCGQLLAMVATRFAQPPGQTCPRCALIFLVESEGPRFGRRDGGSR
ncbi:MAG: hypothetical protein ACRDTD_17995 [Pseudonocardiaceae bacterium]